MIEHAGRHKAPTRCIAALAAVILCWGCSTEAAKGPAQPQPPVNNGVRVETTKGTFTMELYVTDSTMAAAAFLQSVCNPAGLYTGRKFLAPYEAKYYNMMMIDVKKTDPLYIDVVGGVQYRRGTAGMMLGRALEDGTLENSAVGFFICTRMERNMDLLVGHYTPLGQVIEGMDVVDKLGSGDSIVSITPVKVPRRYDGRPLPEPVEPTGQVKE